MRILLVTNGYPPTAYGGVETYSYNLAGSLRARGHEVHIFCRESDPDRPDREILHDEVEGTPITRVVNDFKDISAFRDTYLDEGIRDLFAAHLRLIQPDLVHFQHWIALSADLPEAAAQAGAPCLTTLHDYWALCHRVHLQDWKRRICPGPAQGGDCYACVVGSARPRAWLRHFLRWGKRTTIGRFGQRVRRSLVRDAQSVMALTGVRDDFDLRQRVFRKNLAAVRRVLTPSAYVKEVFAANGYQASAFEVLPLGIDPPPQAGFSATFPGRIRLAYIGSVLPGKGLHVLLEALREVPDERLVLDVYGRTDADPVYARRVEKLVRREPRAQLMGPFGVEEKGAVYRAADVLVIPSLVPETFSLVAREALLSGTPVIAARVGALPEVISEGVNGYLFEPGDVEGLAAVLKRIAADPERLRGLDLPGPTPILSKETHAERLLAIYREVGSQSRS